MRRAAFVVSLCDDEGVNEPNEPAGPVDDAESVAVGAEPVDDTEPEAQVRTHPTRGRVFLAGLRSTSIVCLQMILVLVFLYVLMIVLAKFWVILLPVVLAIIVCTVLWPPVRWLRARRVPPAAAVILVVLLALGVIGGIIGLIVPSIVDQAPDLANRAGDGIQKVQDWAQGPPLNIGDEQISSFVDEITHKLQTSATTIASGVFSGVGVATSVLVTLFATVVLVFFFLKDGPRFIPWLNRTMGVAPERSHLGEVLLQMWNTLGGFIRTQAIVSFVDAALIGAGLLILNVPLAGVLIVITFLGGFIPIVGAFVAGALAVLIALVSGSVTKALIVLGIILVVQQLEGNVLQPWLQAKSMNLHAVIVLLSVTLGGTLFGITGAFLAVPAVSCLAVAVRYILQQIGTAAGEQVAEEDAEALTAARDG
ncbi:Putative transport protein [Gordonia sp. MP11Mi]|uniref:Transport protein n=1 Tax=Gordonia sp. MP11Mi TaxID=3022769 RepID=A0AA97CWX8_9ACTN